jgi:glycosyltransferase involved in cell wall biosynthesis
MNSQLRVLLVPDYVQWVTGTMAKNIAKFAPGVSVDIVSAGALGYLIDAWPFALEAYDVVHFLCQYSSKEWIPRLQPTMSTVSTIHHIADWELDQHNLAADLIIVVSENWRETLVSRGVNRDKIFCYSNGIDTSLFKPMSAAARNVLRAQNNFCDCDIVVGFFGKVGSNNHNDRKGIDIFESGLVALNAHVSSVAALIIGPGWETLVHRLRRAGVKVTWIPFVETNEEMANFHNILDFYWVTARVEGGPVTLLEAMSCGTPCLTTLVGLVPEIGDHRKNMLITSREAPEEFARETARLSNDAELRTTIGKAARRTILAEKDLSITVPPITKAYKHALSCAGRLRHGHKNIGGHHCQQSQIPEAVAAEIRVREDLHWAEALCGQDQKALGISRIVYICVRNPLNSVAWRYLARNTLPKPLVEMIVKLRSLTSK